MKRGIKAKQHEKMNEITRFFIAGTIINATDYSFYFLLFHFINFNIAKGISFICAGVAGYILNKYWVLKQNRPSGVEVGRYALISFLALGANVAINHILLNMLSGAVVLAVIVASIFSGLLTFICLKWWVFRVR